jgi:hypothetical protein
MDFSSHLTLCIPCNITLRNPFPENKNKTIIPFSISGLLSSREIDIGQRALA